MRRVEEMQRRDGREPSFQQVCAETSKTARQVKLQLAVGRMRNVSFESCQDHGHDVAYDSPDRNLERAEGIVHMRSCIGDLSEREQLVIRLRFGLGGVRPRTLAEIGRMIGRTTERVRQIEEQALKNLRKIFEEREFGNAMAV
jgi:RNA polymerase primary sigma factor